MNLILVKVVRNVSNSIALMYYDPDKAKIATARTVKISHNPRKQEIEWTWAFKVRSLVTGPLRSAVIFGGSEPSDESGHRKSPQKCRRYR